MDVNWKNNYIPSLKHDSYMCNLLQSFLSKSPSSRTLGWGGPIIIVLVDKWFGVLWPKKKENKSVFFFITMRPFSHNVKLYSKGVRSVHGIPKEIKSGLLATPSPHPPPHPSTLTVPIATFSILKLAPKKTHELLIQALWLHGCREKALFRVIWKLGPHLKASKK